MDMVITKVHFLLELVSNKVTVSDRNIFKFFLRQARPLFEILPHPT